MSKFLKPLRFLLLFFAISEHLSAQEANNECINFSDSIAQGTYGRASGAIPGSILFTDDGVTVMLQKFLYLDGTTDFINATISDEPLFDGDESQLLKDEYVFPSNINLQFNFTRLPRPVRQVCINFIDGGGEENISVNGKPIKVLRNFLEINGQEIAPGVKAKVTLSEDFDFPAGVLCLTGAIDSLLIGGQELALDNLCYETEEDEEVECRIRNLQIKPTPCGNRGTENYYLLLNFDSENTSDTFVLWLNGNETRRFTKRDLPLQLGPFSGIINETFHYKVFDLRNPDCRAEMRLQGIRCGGSPSGDTCALREGRFSDLECIADNKYRVTINFVRGDTGENFILKTQGGFEQVYSYNALPIRIALPRTENGKDVLTICDKQNPNCCTKIELTLPCRDTSDRQCSIRNLRAQPTECEDGKFKLKISFESSNTGTSGYLVFVDGRLFGPYPYTQTSIVVGPFESNESEIYDILLLDREKPFCYDYLEIRAPDCDDDDDDDDNSCPIRNLKVETLGCNTNGTFNLKLNFETDSNRADSFLVKFGGEPVGRFAVSQLPLTLPNLRRDGEPNSEEITVCFHRPDDDNDDDEDDDDDGGDDDDDDEGDDDDDREENTCCTKVRFTLPDCDDTSNNDDTCRISEVRVETLGCNPSGSFGLKLDFRYPTNTVVDSFTVRFGDRNFGRFSVNQLPLTLQNLPGAEASRRGSLQICFGNGNASSDFCCKEAEFTIPACQDSTDTDTCRIYNVRATALACDSTGKFLVKLKFEHNNGERDSFNVRGNGRNYGNFSYARDSIWLGPLAGDGRTRYEFIVKDLEHANCKAETVISPVSCEEGVWPGDANTNGIANHFDLLNIGIAYGARGPARTERGISWREQSVPLWMRTFANGDNYANADCNGDGVVNVDDRRAIIENYGLTHGTLQPTPELPGTNIDPPIFVDLPDIQGLPNGLAFSAPVVLGTQRNFLDTIYGVGFTIEFDPAIIDPASIQVTYPKSWFGTENVDMITFHRIDREAGLIHIAITRIDQRNVSGFGSVAMISGIIDDIAGRYVSEVNIRQVYALDVSHNLIPLQTPSQQLLIKAQDSEVGRLDLRLSLRLLPNPTHDEVQIFTRYNVPIHAIEILDANGKPMRPPARNTDRVSMADLPQGIYFLRIQIGEYIIHERIVKM